MIGRPPTPLKDRFWPKVRKTRGCWIWIASVDGYGYGMIGLTGSSMRAHRASWEFEYGKIPSGIYVCHDCDNPPCIRPSHLFLGTPKENIQDSVRKNRMAHGENYINSKLTNSDVFYIRAAYPKETTKALANIFNISRSQIYNILSRVSWAHI